MRLGNSTFTFLHLPASWRMFVMSSAKRSTSCTLFVPIALARILIRLNRFGIMQNGTWLSGSWLMCHHNNLVKTSVALRKPVRVKLFERKKNFFSLLRDGFSFIRESTSLFRKAFSLLREGASLLRDGFSFIRESTSLFRKRFLFITRWFLVYSRKYLVISKSFLVITRWFLVYSRKYLVISKSFLVITRWFLVYSRKYLVISKRFLFITRSFLVITRWLLVYSRKYLVISKRFSLLCPQLRRSWRSILVSGCECVRASVRSRTMHARVLKFHVWISYGKIFDTRFFLVRVTSLSGVMPLWKNPNEIWCMPSYEPCMLGFWNFIYGFIMEK